MDAVRVERLRRMGCEMRTSFLHMERTEWLMEHGEPQLAAEQFGHALRFMRQHLEEGHIPGADWLAAEDVADCIEEARQGKLA